MVTLTKNHNYDTGDTIGQVKGQIVWQSNDHNIHGRRDPVLFILPTLEKVFRTNHVYLGCCSS